MTSRIDSVVAAACGEGIGVTYMKRVLTATCLSVEDIVEVLDDTWVAKRFDLLQA